MVLFPRKNTECRKCYWAQFVHGDYILPRGYVCRINPFKSVEMGLLGKHSERKENIKEMEEETEYL